MAMIQVEVKKPELQPLNLQPNLLQWSSEESGFMEWDPASERTLNDSNSVLSKRFLFCTLIGAFYKWVFQLAEQHGGQCREQWASDSRVRRLSHSFLWIGHPSWKWPSGAKQYWQSGAAAAIRSQGMARKHAKSPENSQGTVILRWK